MIADFCKLMASSWDDRLAGCTTTFEVKGRSLANGIPPDEEPPFERVS